MVTDQAGIDDRSFNATTWKGFQDARRALGVRIKYLESSSQSDYAPNIRALEQARCNLIVTVGFLLESATKAAATADPHQKFAIVDDAFSPPIPNVLGMVFATDQASFLAGYLAAAMTRTGKVGTFGGLPIPPVEVYANGFAAGVLYYDRQRHAHVRLLGWNPKTRNGLFIGNFTDVSKGRTATQSLLGQGADIILPLAGAANLGAAAAVEAARARMIWADVDGCVSVPQFCNVFITSVEKRMDVATEHVIRSALDGTFRGGTYLGTLANGGVGLAPFHDYAGRIPAGLRRELAVLERGIESGTISTNPARYE